MTSLMTSSLIIIIDTKRATSQTSLPVSFTEVLVSFNRCALLRYLQRLILASERTMSPTGLYLYHLLVEYFFQFFFNLFLLLTVYCGCVLCMHVCVYGHLPDSNKDWLTDWLIYWLIDWLICQFRCLVSVAVSKSRSRFTNDSVYMHRPAQPPTLSESENEQYIAYLL